MSNQSQMNQNLEQLLDKLPSEIRTELKQKLTGVLFYTPKIGVMGKSGAGKSSLINALIGKNACKTGGVGGCTREFQEEKINLSGREIIFMDLPGIAENTTYNDDYERLYASKIKDLDLILWVIKVDDRANVNDQKFYQDLIQYYKKERILFVLSQADKAEPTREFDRTRWLPSPKQLDTIEQNRKRLKDNFNVPLDDVIAVSCDYYNGKFDRWNIENLATTIIKKLPAEAKTSMYAVMPEENRTSASKKAAKSAFREVADSIYDTVVDMVPLPTPIKTGLKAVKNKVLDWAEDAWDKFTSWF
ncbi:GTP-binding protein [Rodentibacter trehalosifermentans]|uniref:GTP-binding protein n=1 Tax=Rodentibacter trehalosifermentans TaxID=1908263 RepID=A0A1V3IYI4_9PAST|nr:GTPase [Rodentibacter trehalosifermentans]OOF47096.1 GTP-binding protein [Rodentibacter trehalosifermentans]